MTQAELLRYLVEVLETLGAEYMIGGAQAAIYYGEPRLTRDVDVIVAPPGGGDRDVRADREIEAGGQDDEGHADRDDSEQRDLARHVVEI